MIKSFFKNHKIHKVVTSKLDWLFVFNLPKFIILTAIFSWGMASAYFHVNLSSFPYFSTYFHYADIIIYLGLFLLLGGLNIQNELDKLKYAYSSTKIDYVRDNNNLNYPILASYILNEDKMKKVSIVSIFLGIFIIGVSSINILPTILLYSYLNLFFYKIIIKNKNFAQNVIFSIFTNLLLFISGWIHIVISFTLILEYILIYLLAVLPITLIYELVFFEQASKYEKELTLPNGVNRRNIFTLSIFSLISLFYITYNFKIDPVVSHYALIILPFYIYGLVRGLPKDSIRSFIYPIMVINILLSWTLFPYLFLFVFIVFYISKYYYWHRFDIHFPKFVIEDDE